MHQPKDKYINYPAYRTIVKGQKYACSICGQIYEGPNCRNQAKSCCESVKNPSEPGPNTGHWPYEKLPKEGWNDNIRHSDIEGHYSRAKAHHNEVTYHKCFNTIMRSLQRMNKVLSDFIPKRRRFNPRHSPLQSLSYAYHYGGWQAVKQAAYSLAYDRAIQERLDELNIPEIIVNELSLNQVIKEVIDDIHDLDALDAHQDIRKLVDKYFKERTIEEIEEMLKDGNDQKED